MDDDAEIRQAAQAISPAWLHQPIVVSPTSREDRYRIVAGHLQYHVGTYLGWKSISVIVVHDDPSTFDGEPEIVMPVEDLPGSPDSL